MLGADGYFIFTIHAVEVIVIKHKYGQNVDKLYIALYAMSLFSFFYLCLIQQNTGEERQTYTYLDLIRTPNMRNITILSVLIW